MLERTKNGDERRDAMHKLQMHALNSAMVVAMGVLVLVFMILLEDEPTAVAPFLVLAGAAWHLVTRARMRAVRDRPGS